MSTYMGGNGGGGWVTGNIAGVLKGGVAVRQNECYTNITPKYLCHPSIHLFILYTNLMQINQVNY